MFMSDPEPKLPDTTFERCERTIDDLTNNRITGKQLDRLDKAVDRSKSDQSIGQSGPARRPFGSPF
jgi:hypothetical protein